LPYADFVEVAFLHEVDATDDKQEYREYDKSQLEGLQ
jgi:hypothetical protein